MPERSNIINLIGMFPAIRLFGFLLLCAVLTGTAVGLGIAADNDLSAPVAILSIIPSQAEPGMTVTLYGSGFTDATRVFLGNSEAPSQIVGPRQLSFHIPDVAPGMYGLYVKREDGAISKVYRFSVTPRTPVIHAVSPEKIYACDRDGTDEVHISGSNFQDGSQVLFNGAVIKSRYLSPESIVVRIPRLAGGLHTIQVRNPGGTVSSNVAFFIDSKPEITSITQGDDYVNHYDLIIEGRNFGSNSTVVVDGKSMTPSSVNWADREKVVFVNCNRIVYKRFPYDFDVKRFTVQVINPNGESSAAVEVSAP